MTDPVFQNLAFDDAIKYFSGKVNLPTKRWDDLWQGMHARAFMVAGATKEALLTDFHETLLKARTDGMTLRQFRKEFDHIVDRHGWDYKGGRNWRSRVIFDTNMRTSYSAGRYRQMTDPDVVQDRPYWEYKHGDSIHPRMEHLAWNGLILRYDDPWWKTHWPPNGWGCSCKAFALGQRDLDREGKSVGTAPDDGTYEWTDNAGQTHTIPNGIDPGWDYNVGEAAWGRTQALRLMEDQGPWTDIDPWGPEKYGRADIDFDMPRAAIGTPVKKGDTKALADTLIKAVGSEEAVFFDPLGEPFMVTRAITDHIAQDPKRWDGREAYFPLIPETIENTFEIWASFAKSEVSGRVAIRKKYVKAVQLPKNKTLGLVAESMNGFWVGATFFRGSVSGLKNLRKGRLIYGR